MLFFTKLTNRYCGKVLTVTSVQNCDDKNSNDSTAIEQMRKATPAKSVTILCRLLVSLLAFASAAPVLLAEDRDHEPGKANDLVGVWMETNTANGHKALVTFHQDGTASLDIQGDVAFEPIQSHEHGLWKEHGFLTFIANFFVIEYNRDASFAGTVLVQILYKLYPSGDQYDATAFFTETLANGQVNQGGPVSAHGVRQILIPPPL